MRNITHVSRCGKVSRIFNFRFRKVFFDIFHKQVIQSGTACQGKHPGQRFNNGLCSDSRAARFECLVNTAVLAVDGLHGFRTDVEFHAHIGGDIINQVAPLGNDGMDTDHIIFFERFTKGIDPHNPQACRIQRIDAFMRGIGRMSGLSYILHCFPYKTVA